MSKYLISKVGDPVFALFIGMAAAWTRVRREELDRFKEQLKLQSDSSQLQQTSSLSSAEITAGRSLDAASSPSPPTAVDTLRTFGRRIGQVKWNPKEWDWEWKDLWRNKDSWGIVNPNDR